MGVVVHVLLWNNGRVGSLNRISPEIQLNTMPNSTCLRVAGNFLSAVDCGRHSWSMLSRLQLGFLGINSIQKSIHYFRLLVLKFLIDLELKKNKIYCNIWVSYSTSGIGLSSEYFTNFYQIRLRFLWPLMAWLIHCMLKEMQTGHLTNLNLFY